MAEISIITESGQSVYDIAIQYYGSAEQVGKVLENEIITSIIEIIPSGTVLTLKDVEENSVNTFFASKRAIATKNFKLPLYGDDDDGEIFDDFLTGDEGQFLFGDD